MGGCVLAPARGHPEHQLRKPKDKKQSACRRVGAICIYTARQGLGHLSLEGGGYMPDSGNPGRKEIR